MRRSAALVLFIGLVAVSIDRQLLSIFVLDRRAVSRYWTQFPDRGWYPEFPRFLEMVRERTQRGDSVAILVPATRWEGGYSYAYYRASYFLSGREVLPLITPNDRTLPDNLERADYVAVWPERPLLRRTVVLRAHRGALLGR